MIWEVDAQAREVEGLDADGRPIPAYAASLGLVRAPFGARALATIVEILIWALLQVPFLVLALPKIIDAVGQPDPVKALTGDGFALVIIGAAVTAGLNIAFTLVTLILLGRKGVTIGKAVSGIRVVNVRTLARPGFWRGAVLRSLVLSASTIVPVIGPILLIMLSPLMDPLRRGRGWADMAASTWFVDVRGGLNPYDEKRMRIARKTVASDLTDEREELRSLATPAGPRRSDTAYIPVARNRGGVLGALRNETPEPVVEVAAPAVPTVVAGTPAPAPVASGAPSVQPPSAGPGGWQPPSLMRDSPAVAVEPVVEPVAPVAAEPAPVAAVPVPAAEPDELSATLTIDTGEELLVGDGIVLGRAPSSVHGARTIQLPDPTMSVSKTHIVVRPVEGGFAVEDLGSTNGSGLTRAGVAYSLTPNQAALLVDGDTVHFGDRTAEVRIR